MKDNKLTLEKAKTLIGRQVTYTPFKGCDYKEYGVITSVTDNYVFVRYGSDICSKATKAEDLVEG